MTGPASPAPLGLPQRGSAGVSTRPTKAESLSIMQAQIRAMGAEPDERPLLEVLEDAEVKALASTGLPRLIALAEHRGWAAWVVRLVSVRVLELRKPGRDETVRVKDGDPTSADLAKRKIAGVIAHEGEDLFGVLTAARSLR